MGPNARCTTYKRRLRVSPPICECLAWPQCVPSEMAEAPEEDKSSNDIRPLLHSVSVTTGLLIIQSFQKDKDDDGASGLYGPNVYLCR